MVETTSASGARPCPACQGGVLHLRYQTYFVWLRTEMITVPDFPTWVCDLCGYRESDARAARWLGILLSPNVGRSVRREHSARPAARSGHAGEQQNA